MVRLPSRRARYSVREDRRPVAEKEGRVREAWVMRLKPGNEAIYKEKHDNIWPEMLEVMKASGIRNYSIYRHGLTLFAYLEREGPPPPPTGRAGLYLAGTANRPSRGPPVVPSARTLASHEMKDATELAVGISPAGFEFDCGHRRYLL